jgi:hypothetical protein
MTLPSTSPLSLLQSPSSSGFSQRALRQRTASTAQSQPSSADFAHKLHDSARKKRSGKTAHNKASNRAGETRKDQSGDSVNDQQAAPITEVSQADQPDDAHAQTSEQPGDAHADPANTANTQSPRETQPRNDAAQQPPKNPDTEKSEDQSQVAPLTIRGLSQLLLQGHSPAKTPSASIDSVTPAQSGQSDADSADSIGPAAHGINPDHDQSQSGFASSDAQTGADDKQPQTAAPLDNAHAVEHASAAAHNTVSPAADLQTAENATVSTPNTPSSPNVNPSQAATQQTAPISMSMPIASNLLDRLGAPSLARFDAPAADATPQQMQALSAQAERGLAAALNQRTGAVTVRLNPESLGQIKVQVQVAQGAITAAFEVTSPKTRDLFNKSLHTLRQTLRDKGLNVQDVKITLAPQLPKSDLALSVSHLPTPDASAQTPTGDNGSSNPNNQHAAADQPAFSSLSNTLETPIDLAMPHPDSAIGRAQYVALPDGRIGVMALA